MTDEPYTRVPNALLELLATLPDAECRVMLVIIRKTAGWQKQCDVISYTQLEAATGMSRQGVINGVNAALARGILRRVASGQNNGYCYEVVNEVDRSTSLTTCSSQRSRPLSASSSQRSRPLVVNEVDHLAPQVVNEVDTQKKDSKEKKERGTAPRKRGARSPRRDIIFEAVCEACGIDWHVCTETQRQQANQTAETLRRAAGKHHVDDAGTADRIRHARRHWKLHDWRGRNGDNPTPAQLREIWGAAMKTYTPPAAPPPAAPPAAESPRVLTGAALAEYMRSRRNGADDPTV